MRSSFRPVTMLALPSGPGWFHGRQRALVAVASIVSMAPAHRSFAADKGDLVTVGRPGRFVLVSRR